MKACWRCAEQIQDAAVACRFCGANQNSLERQQLGAAPGASKFANPADGFKPIIRLAIVIALLFGLGKCMSGPSDTPAESKPLPETAEQTSARLDTCRKAEKIGRAAGLIREIRPATRNFGANFYEIIVNERLWKTAEYKAKMMVALIPICLDKAGSLGTSDDIVMVKSDLTNAKLAGGSPAAGTVSIESD